MPVASIRALQADGYGAPVLAGRDEAAMRAAVNANMEPACSRLGQGRAAPRRKATNRSRVGRRVGVRVLLGEPNPKSLTSNTTGRKHADSRAALILRPSM
jgi:hypothetical protein